ncbi:hypothetical protein ANMWB30_24060 [Arthrobacter sp. MWB30]|nr:hypothetical protein ANMWB30_24060 [Arthrobacter sp. MWB30]
MEHRSAITLKAYDVISIPGIGNRYLLAIHRIRDDRYQLRLDEKFMESITVDVAVSNGGHRSPERQQDPKKLSTVEYRPTITLTSGDLIEIPGIGPTRIGTIHQTDHAGYQIRLDGESKKSVTVDISVGDGGQRTPERHEGPWISSEQ